MFKDGDIVILKSGGPQMTITRADVEGDPNLVFCRWFDDKGELKGHRFMAAALKLIEDVDPE